MRKGFTLTELLGVIFLLGLIALIIVPPIVEHIRVLSKDVSAATKELIYAAADEYIDENRNKYLLVQNDVYCLKIETLINNGHLIENLVDIKSGKKIDVEKTVKVEIENLANKNYSLVNPEQCIEVRSQVDRSGANAPVLAQGMTGIKFNDNGSDEPISSEIDPDWYDYSNKLWANAKTEDGSYWVWIPRFAYRITNGYHANQTGKISIKFLKNSSNDAIDGTKIEVSNYDVETKNTSNKYFVHSAFTFGNKELEGFWVAKFEPSGSLSNINVIPNEPSLRNWTIGEFFDAALNMKNNSKYGFIENEVDTHMMKNTEWGAVAYLAKSDYGAGVEVWKNNSSQFITGCAGNSVSEQSVLECQNEYNEAIGWRASTTHNITGIYDMNGGADEFVAAYINNDKLSNGQSVKNAPNHYKNVYSIGSSDTAQLNYEINKNKFGDAIFETSSSYSENNSWFQNSSSMPTLNDAWFSRGGLYSETGAGLFSFTKNAGHASADWTFRPVIILN